MLAKRLYTVVLLSLLAGMGNGLIAQDTTNFFPHHVGDMWEYFFTDFVGEDTIQVYVAADSLDPDGNHHVIQVARSINPVEPPIFFFRDSTEYIADTANQVLEYFSFGSGPLVKYKLDAQEGDQWVLWGYPGYYEMARVDKVEADTIFGVPTITKSYVYYLAQDSIDTTGLIRYGDKLAGGFGLISRWTGETGAWIFSRGAIIDGITYGDTTLVGINFSRDTVLPEHIELLQNYPNPFNPETTLPFRLDASGQVTLVVYDALGRVVNRLIDHEWHFAGAYEINWNGKTQKGGEVASGLYFYQLIVGQQRLTRRMLLTR